MAHLARVSRDLDSQLITLLRWEHAAAPDGFSWLSQAVTYLDLLRPFMAALREWPRPVLEDMLSCFRQHAGAILKKLSDLRRHIRVVEAAYGPVWALADAAHRQVAECFGPYGDPSLPPAASPAPRFQCPECSASFHDLRRLQAHGEGTGVGIGVGTGGGTGMGTFVGTSVGTGIETGAGIGVGADVGAGIAAGVDTGVGPGMGPGVGTEVGAGVGTGVGIGASTGGGTIVSNGVGNGVDTGVGAGGGLGVGTGVGAAPSLHLFGDRADS